MEPGPDVTAEDLKVFLQEADEQLQLLDEDIIRLEKEADNVDLLQEIFRAAHTLKGSSGMLGFDKMAGLTHSMEDVLDRLRKGTLAVSAEVVDALLQSLDALKVLMENLGSGGEGTLDVAPIVAALRAAAEAGGDAPPAGGPTGSLETAAGPDPAALERLGAAAAAGLSCYDIRVALDEQTTWAAVRCLQVVNEASSLGEVVWSAPSLQEIDQEKVGSQLRVLLATSLAAEEVRASIAPIEDVQAVEVAPWRAPGEDEPSAAEPPSDDADRRVIDLGAEARGRSQREQLELAAQKIETLQTVRIDVDRLDDLMNMVGELVIDRTRVSQISKALQSRYREDELTHALSDTTLHIVKVVDELNESMMQLRMLPVGLLFNKFPRLVRDLARSTGKSIDFVVEGQDTEIDRSVIEKIKDPLVHLLRNAVDHGIESPEARRAAGKPLPALVRLSARHEQGHIVITLEDDGKGIDAQVIKESAVRKGIIAPEAAERLSDDEALDLIFESGVSTAEKTTDVSGRGVGMDIVSKGIGALNGVIKIDTHVHVGTTFTLRLPLTLAIFPGLLVSSRDTVYAIPLNYVEETVRLEPGSIKTITGREVFHLRGDVLPLIRLSSIRRTESNGADRAGEDFVVVVKAGDRPVALAVDALLEQQEIVAKSLGGYMGDVRGIAGASILGDGRVVLILDIASLTRATVQAKLGLAEAESATPVGVATQ
jgi:two-component system chemotaxis sensor kinase CheA